MTNSKEILKDLKHGFYLYYENFGFWDEQTQHAYELYKNTLIGVLREEKDGKS